jgi:outer membrane protein
MFRFSCILLLAGSAAPAAQRITLAEAEALALRLSPQARMSSLNAAATPGPSRAYLPVVATQVSGVTTGENTRLATGAGTSLTNPAIIPHVGVAVYASQLVTDFGRGAELDRAAALRAQASQESARAAEAALLYQVRVAFHALVRAARLEEIAERAGDSTTAEAQIRLTLARNDRIIASVNLAALVGLRAPAALEPVAPLLEEPAPRDVPAMVARALEGHPQVAQRRRLADAAKHEAAADARLAFPTLVAVATTGWVPLRSERFPDRNFYHAAGLNVALPLFSWRQISAKRAESRARAEAAGAAIQEAENSVARDVTVAAVQLQSAEARAALARAKKRAAATPAQHDDADALLAQAGYEAGIQRAALQLQGGLP